MLRQLLLLSAASFCMYGCFPAAKAGLLDYSQGTTYLYNYRTFTTVNEPHVPLVSNLTKNIGHTITSKVQMTPVWRSGADILIKIVVTSAEIESIGRNVKQDMAYLTQRPIYFHWRSDIVLDVFAADDDSTSAVNLKKGIAALFQVQSLEGDFIETDISGTCAVKYHKLMGMLEKSKTNCQTPEVPARYNTVNQLLGVEPIVTRQTSYVIANEIIRAAVMSERFSHKIGLDSSMGTEIMLDELTGIRVWQEFELTGNVTGDAAVDATGEGASIEEVVRQLGKADGTEYKPRGLQAVHKEVDTTGKNRVPVGDLLGQSRDKLTEENIGSGAAAKVFSDLVEAFRTSSQDTILNALKDEMNKGIVPALIDTVVAAQTSAGQAALTEFLDFTDADEILLPERYLLATALTTHPTSELLQFLLKLYGKNVPNEMLYESIGEALGAVANTFSQQTTNADSELLKEVEKSLLTSLASCAMSPCRLRSLRALLNAGLPTTVPTLLEYVETSSDPDVSEAAIKALRRINTQTDRQVKETMQRVFHQLRRPYDTTVRTCALTLLLTHTLTTTELHAIITETTDPANAEFNLFVQARIVSKAKSNGNLWNVLVDVLEDGKLFNYNVFAQKGHGLAFTSDLAQTNRAAATYHMYVETSKTGNMRRSGMDVDITSTDDQTASIYNFGIYTAGLEALLGEAVEPGKEDQEATAGMSLDLLGVSLRPITFFTGQAGLLAAVWSAPPQLMSALQVNLLLQDYRDTLYLGNGLVAQVDSIGVLSLDLSGSLDVSLWSKYAESLIRNSGGIAMRGSLRIDMEPLTVAMQYSSQAENIIDFKTDVNFSAAVKMCLQMSRPEFVFYHNVTKYEGGPGFPRSHTTTERTTRKFHSGSFPLPPSNTEMCRSLLVKD